MQMAHYKLTIIIIIIIIIMSWWRVFLKFILNRKIAFNENYGGR